MMTIDVPQPAPEIAPKPPAIPLDAEAAALYLAEIMPPAMRAELGRMLIGSTAYQRR